MTTPPMPHPLPMWVIFILLFHPVWLTLLVGLLSGWLIVRLKLWRKHKRIFIAVLVTAAALYVLDALIAFPRIAYAWRIPRSSRHQSKGAAACNSRTRQRGLPEGMSCPLTCWPTQGSHSRRDAPAILHGCATNTALSRRMDASGRLPAGTSASCAFERGASC